MLSRKIVVTKMLDLRQGTFWYCDMFLIEHRLLFRPMHVHAMCLVGALITPNLPVVGRAK